MNEMDLLTRMRDEVPSNAVSPAAERAFFAGLHEPARRPVRSRPRWRLALAGGLSLALAAGAAAGIAWPGPATTSAQHGALTVQVLAARAAGAAAAGPSVSPGQWVYQRMLTVMHPQLGQPQTGNAWYTVDGTKGAFYQHGKLVISDSLMGYYTFANGSQVPIPLPHPWIPYSVLSGLPRDPAALARYLGNYHAVRVRAKGARQWVASMHHNLAFDYISDLLSNYVLAPRLTAELYRAIATIPGITVVQNVTDIAGRRGVAFAFADGSPGFGAGPASKAAGLRTSAELILNPHTYTWMAEELISQSHAVVDGTAILARATVSGPGVHP